MDPRKPNFFYIYIYISYRWSHNHLDLRFEKEKTKAIWIIWYRLKLVYLETYTSAYIQFFYSCMTYGGVRDKSHMTFYVSTIYVCKQKKSEKLVVAVYLIFFFYNSTTHWVPINVFRLFAIKIYNNWMKIEQYSRTYLIMRIFNVRKPYYVKFYRISMHKGSTNIKLRWSQ